MGNLSFGSFGSAQGMLRKKKVVGLKKRGNVGGTL